MLSHRPIFGDAIYIAYYNSYLVYTGKVDANDIIQSDKIEGKNSFFMHNPNRNINQQSDDVFNGFVDTLIEYFSSVEKFEICNELKEIKR